MQLGSREHQSLHHGGGKMKKIILDIGRFIGLTMICLLAIVVLSMKASGGEPKIFGHQMKVVVSGSMEPTLETGSIIINKLIEDTTTFQPKDIITFQSGNKLVTHRIINTLEVNGETLYETKGDNNKSADNGYVKSEHIVGKYASITVPKLGYVVNYFNSKLGAALLLAIPGLLLIFSGSWSIYSSIRQVETQNAS